MMSIGFAEKLRRWMVRSIGIVLATMLLAGGGVALASPMLEGLANIQSKDNENVQFFVQQAFVENRSDLLNARRDILGTSELYVSWDEYRSLIVDGDGLLKYGLGLILAREPDVTYDDFKALRYERFGPLEDVITPVEFAFYRQWGQIYLDHLKSKPENAYLVEREAWFQARAGRDPAGLKSGEDYVALLTDDEKFRRFLTDDNYAVWVISRNVREPVYTHQLGPIFVGVTPGTGS